MGDVLTEEDQTELLQVDMLMPDRVQVLGSKYPELLIALEQHKALIEQDDNEAISNLELEHGALA